MSGHNKWSKIKHKKAKTDAQKGKMFSKIVKEIMIAVKLGGADVSANTRLTLAMQKAKQANMPNDNVSRAIQKGSDIGGDNYEEIMFEAYGPFGVAMIIETLTDNRNRTVPIIKFILGKANGSLASKGAVSYLFDQKGLILFEPGVSEEEVMDVATNAGAEDVDLKEDGSIEVVSEAGDLNICQKAFEQAGLEYVSASLEMIPRNTVSLDEDQAEKILRLVDTLEEDDDVQNVYANFEIADEILEKLNS
jgi:YebC/PmpR family DNA-binding regulatory protein